MGGSQSGTKNRVANMNNHDPKVYVLNFGNLLKIRESKQSELMIPITIGFIQVCPGCTCP